MRDVTRVLIVDDHPHARQGLRAMLAGWPGIHVVGEAGGGREAVARVEADQPDVVLMDVSMPGMNGLEATHLIKVRWPAVRVIILTMYPIYQSAALMAGADAFLVKGCRGEELSEAIRG